MRKKTFYSLLRIIPKPVLKFAKTIKWMLTGELFDMYQRMGALLEAPRWNTGMQLRGYKQWPGAYRFENTINQYEAKIFSQHGEDGILLHIFSTIGSHSRRFVEIGIGDGKECNTANLCLNFGWQGLMLEANDKNAAFAQTYYKNFLGENSGRVQIAHAFVTRENINSLLEKSGMAGEIDLLSMDIDGNDFWVWEAIEVVQPRVVVIEYNASFGPSRALTISYNPGFRLENAHPSGFYHGASLSALARLGAKKGYSLVGCDTSGVNAFFVRRTSMRDGLRALEPEEAFFPHYKRTARFDPEEQFRMISHLGFEEV